MPLNLTSLACPRQRTVNLVLLASLSALFACKSRRSAERETTPSVPKAADVAVSLAGVESRDREQVKDEQLIRVDIAKRIMGLNPKADDRHDHIGLINVADLMGYELPFNDCGRAWLLRQGVDEVAITSYHGRGVGASCQNQDSAAPVSYSFSRWALEPEAVVPVPLSGVPESTTWPKATANSNANTSSAVTASIDQAGALKLVTRETILASVTATADVFTHRVSYERSIPIDPTFTKQWQQAAAGLQILPGVGGGATFSFGSAAKAEQRLSRVSCGASVLQPQGCHYRVFLTAEHTIQQQKYRAMINLYPKVVGLTGLLRGDSRSMRKLNGDGQNSGSAVVSESFGRGDEIDFIDDLAEQVAGGRGNWHWEQMRSLPLAQKDGIPTLDWALRYFAGQDFGGLSYDFLRTTESVQSCLLHVEVLPDSAGSCVSLQDGAVVEPVAVPIL